MGLDYDKVIGQIRTDVRSPELSAPSDDQIMQRIGDIAQLFHLEQQNTSVNWDVTSFDLGVQTGLGKYQIPAEFFGKPLRIHTIDPSDRYHVTRKVEVAVRQEIEKFWKGEEMSASGALHTAACAVMEWEFGAPTVEIIPAPAQPAFYRIWFETGEVPDPRRGGQPIPGLPSFHRYVRVYGSALILPYCEWSDMVDAGWTKTEKEAAWKERRLELAAAFEPLISRWTSAWREYIATNQQVGTGAGRGYADWFEQDCV